MERATQHRYWMANVKNDLLNKVLTTNQKRYKDRKTIQTKTNHIKQGADKEQRKHRKIYTQTSDQNKTPLGGVHKVKVTRNKTRPGKTSSK